MALQLHFIASVAWAGRLANHFSGSSSAIRPCLCWSHQAVSKASPLFASNEWPGVCLNFASRNLGTKLAGRAPNLLATRTAKCLHVCGHSTVQQASFETAFMRCCSLLRPWTDSANCRSSASGLLCTQTNKQRTTYIHK